MNAFKISFSLGAGSEDTSDTGRLGSVIFEYQKLHSNYNMKKYGYLIENLFLWLHTKRLEKVCHKPIPTFKKMMLAATSKLVWENGQFARGNQIYGVKYTPVKS